MFLCFIYIKAFDIIRQLIKFIYIDIKRANSFLLKKHRCISSKVILDIAIQSC